MALIQEDTNVRLSRMQREIREHLGMKDDDLLFDFRELDGIVRLDLVTISPRHNQSFLFHTTEGTDKTDALIKMIDYVKRMREAENTYTLQWMGIDDRELHTSYFRAKNMYEALDKLYYGRDINTINVYSLKLNPIA